MTKDVRLINEAPKSDDQLTNQKPASWINQSQFIRGSNNLGQVVGPCFLSINISAVAIVN